VGVRDGQPNVIKPSVGQRPQERGPEVFVSADSEVEAEHLPAPVGGHPDRDDESLGHAPVSAQFALARLRTWE